MTSSSPSPKRTRRSITARIPAASTEYAGVTLWTLGSGGAHAIIGGRLLFSNRI